MKRQILTVAVVGALIGAIAAVTYFSGGNIDMAALGGIVLANAPALAPAAPVTEKDLANAINGLKQATDGVKTWAEKAEKEMKDLGAMTEATKKASDDALIKYAAVVSQLGDIEQKLATIRFGGSNDNEPRSAGHALINSEQWKPIGALGPKWRGRARFDVERSSLEFRSDIMTAPAARGGVLVEEMRIPGIIQLPNRRLTVRNLIAPGRTSSNAFKYIRELGFTNAAAVVSEGQLKPQSDITWEAVTGNVSTIAHWIRASNQILADAPGLQSTIDARLRYGLAFAEEGELLRGDGTGEHLEGLITAATAYSAPINPAGTETRIDIIRLAMLQVFLAEFPPDGIVMSPQDWTHIELTKTTDGAYLMANPAGTLLPRLWGLPVVSTQAMNVDEFLVGAFQLAAQIFDREDATVELSTEDQDNFIRNMVTIRAEERLALAIYRPEALVHGDFGFVT